MNVKNSIDENDVGLSLKINRLITKGDQEQPISKYVRNSPRKATLNQKINSVRQEERSLREFNSHGSFYFIETDFDYLKNAKLNENSTSRSRKIHFNNDIKSDQETSTELFKNVSEKMYQIKMPCFSRFWSELETLQNNSLIKSNSKRNRSKISFSYFS
ncbi:unnamed protein product [Brachionus calyciflorus]|uniref:Uncharacterized protein n=1 Tax=Brachionus calyciflorus TaxID=104777 RepID=A0A813UJG0_9BILA|nr:unnamed protein product [Brachionus calyciflorus]